MREQTPQHEIDIFSANLIKIMEASHTDASTLCQDLGFCRDTIRSWLNRKAFPNIVTLEKLSAYFGVKQSELTRQNRIKPVAEQQLIINKYLSKLSANEVEKVQFYVRKLYTEKQR